jgi:hypothetical protein
MRGWLPPLLGSSLSTVVIFLPFALVTGITGAFFRPLALTMALALGVSFLLSALAVPAAVRSIGAAHGRGRSPGEGGMPRLRKVVGLFVRKPGLGVISRRSHGVGRGPLARHRYRLPARDGRGIDHPRLLDAAGDVAHGYGPDARRGGEDHPVHPGRRELFATHRNAAWILHHRAQPGRLRDQVEAQAPPARRGRGHRRPAPEDRLRGAGDPHGFRAAHRRPASAISPGVRSRST